MDLQYFKATLRQRLRDKKLTLNSLSTKADLSEDTLRSIIYGKPQDIKLSTMIKIADVLNCSLDDLVERSFYSKQTQNIISRLNHLPKRSLNTIQFILDLEEKTALPESTEGTNIIRILLPTGNMKDGMFYDSSSYEKLDISQYPEILRSTTDVGVKILSKNYEPIYYQNDILLLSHRQLPQYNDTVLYISDNGQLYLRNFLETGLEPLNGFGKRISSYELDDYTALGVVLKVVKEFDIEQYR